MNCKHCGEEIKQDSDGYRHVFSDRMRCMKPDTPKFKGPQFNYIDWYANTYAEYDTKTPPPLKGHGPGDGKDQGEGAPVEGQGKQGEGKGEQGEGQGEQGKGEGRGQGEQEGQGEEGESKEGEGKEGQPKDGKDGKGKGDKKDDDKKDDKDHKHDDQGEKCKHCGKPIHPATDKEKWAAGIDKDKEVYKHDDGFWHCDGKSDNPMAEPKDDPNKIKCGTCGLLIVGTKDSLYPYTHQVGKDKKETLTCFAAIRNNGSMPKNIGIKTFQGDLYIAHRKAKMTAAQAIESRSTAVKKVNNLKKELDKLQNL